MPCYIRMKRIFLQGLLWLYLLGFGFMALSLEPGFLDFDNLPDTNFTCVGKVIGGYYADLETNCQMFHVCTIGQMDEPMDIRFLCLNGTVFDQETRVCERIDEVDCSKSEHFYSLNLELYGNTYPANLEDNIETDQPLIIKSTATTTTTPAPTKRTTRLPYYTTSSIPKGATTGRPNPQVHSHHFPVNINPNSADIRFNPEEINISLHPGAPPDIRTKHYPSYSDKKVTNSESGKVIVTKNRDILDSERRLEAERGQIQVPTKKFSRPTPASINYHIGYREPNDGAYRTESSAQEFQFHREFRPSQEYSGPLHNAQYKATTYQSDYNPTTQKLINYQQHKSATTARTYFIQSLKPPAPNQQNHYIQHRTENPPQRFQLPLPLLPTLPPITFSSPAPFALQHHIETKRYTKDNLTPPRIIISASASVSDASGRRLNYSLGTIGAAQILEEPPNSYDEYKDEDVGLDPFYHDVPRIKQVKRKKRGTERQVNPSDIIKNDEEAVRVLKFLFDWYKNEKTNLAHTTTPVTSVLPSGEISKLNDELSFIEKSNSETKGNEDSKFTLKESDLFNKKSKYSIIGDVKEVNADHKEYNIHENFTNSDVFIGLPQDYVDDNYEPETYNRSHLGYIAESNDKPLYKNTEQEIMEDAHKNDDAGNKPLYEETHQETRDDGQKNETKDYYLSLDYVDDNVEPIYFKDRHPYVDERTRYLNQQGLSEESDVRHKKPSLGYFDESKVKLQAEIIDNQERYTQNSPDKPEKHIADTKENEEIVNTEQMKYEKYDTSTINLNRHPSAEDFAHTLGEGEVTLTKTPSPTEMVDSSELSTANGDIIKEKAQTEVFQYEPTVKTEISFFTKVSEGFEPTESSFQHSNYEDDQSYQSSESYNTAPVLQSNAINRNAYESIGTNSDIASDTHLLIAKPTKASKIRGRNSRGRRKDHYRTESKEQGSTVRNVLIEKRVERPYRAKDDYDFLRTLSNVHSSTLKSPPVESHDKDPMLTRNENNTSIAILSTFTEPLSNSTDFSVIDDINVPTATEKIKPRNSRRRGRTRYSAETNNKPSRKRKPTKNPGRVELSTIGISSSDNHEIDKTLPSLKSLLDQTVANSVAGNGSLVEIINADSLHSEPFSEIIASTTEHAEANSFAKSNIIEEKLAEGITDPNSAETAQTTSASHLENIQALGTPAVPLTESLFEKDLFSTSPQSTIESNIEVTSSETNVQLRTLGEMYATTFIPTKPPRIKKEKELTDALFDPKSTVEPGSNMGTFWEYQYEFTTGSTISDENVDTKKSIIYVPDEETTAEIFTVLPSEAASTTKSDGDENQVPTTFWANTTPPNLEHADTNNSDNIEVQAVEETTAVITTLNDLEKYNEEDEYTRTNPVYVTEENGIIPNSSKHTIAQNDNRKYDEIPPEKKSLDKVIEGVKESAKSRSRSRSRNSSSYGGQKHFEVETTPRTTANDNSEKITREGENSTRGILVSAERSRKGSRGTPRNIVNSNARKIYSEVVEDSENVRNEANNLNKDTVENLVYNNEEKTTIDITHALTTEMPKSYLEEEASKSAFIEDLEDITTLSRTWYADNSIEDDETTKNGLLISAETDENDTNSSPKGTEENTSIMNFSEGTTPLVIIDTTENSEVVVTESETQPSKIPVKEVSKGRMHGSAKSSISAETTPTNIMWTTENLETFIKEVENSTRSVVASAEKIGNGSKNRSRDDVKDNVRKYHLVKNNEEHKQEEKVAIDKHYEDIKSSDDVSHNAIKILPYDLEEKLNTTTFLDTTTSSTFFEETTLTISTGIDATSNSSITESTTVNNTGTLNSTTLELTTLPPTAHIDSTSPIEESWPRLPSRGSRRKNLRKRPSSDYQTNSYRHRFSTEQSTNKPENRRQTIENEIIGALTRQSKSTTKPTLQSKNTEEAPTNAPLWRSASPTQAERSKDSLVTTPLSKKMKKMNVRKHYFFNCFNKEIDKFYPDPRDCRLFHYCTQGYNKNQLLDMKFVCDLNTYFNDEDLVCTKRKPTRCL